jgi:hypothetical protein
MVLLVYGYLILPRFHNIRRFTIFQHGSKNSDLTCLPLPKQRSKLHKRSWQKKSWNRGSLLPGGGAPSRRRRIKQIIAAPPRRTQQVAAALPHHRPPCRPQQVAAPPSLHHAGSSRSPLHDQQIAFPGRRCCPSTPQIVAARASSGRRSDHHLPRPSLPINRIASP